MDKKELETISKLLKRVKETQPMTTAENKAIVKLMLDIENKKTVENCREFLEYMNTELSVLETDDEELIERFYNKDITIGFGYKSVTIYNNADTFESVCNLLEDFIVDYSK